MLGLDGYRDGPMSIYPGYKEHFFTAEDFGRMLEAGILRAGDGDELRDGRVTRDAGHLDGDHSLRGVPGEYCRDEALRACVRMWTQAEMFSLTEIGAFEYHKHAILWGGRVYDPLRPSPATCCVHSLVWEQLRSKVASQEWAAIFYGPLTLREGFLPNPDLVVLPRSALRGRHWPPARDCPLVIEVGDPELPGNKGFKLAEYDRAGVPDTWVVDVAGRRVAAHRRGRYDRPELYHEGESIALPLGGLETARIEVSELFSDLK